MRVRVGVSQDSVAEGNCVIVRWGGEQPEANWRSAGDELDSAGSDGEPARRWRSLKRIGYADIGVQSDIRVTHVVGGGTLGSVCEISGETCARGDACQESEPS